MVREVEASLERAMTIINEIDFPTLPLYLQLIQKEMRKKNASISKIAEFVSQDIALTAKVLKTVNSAAFSSKYRIDNIPQAITTLGMTNFYISVLSESIKNQLNSHQFSSNNFNVIWKHSTETAFACQFLAEQLNNNIDITQHFDPNHAYLTGLFHDCGIPIMASRYSDYEELAVTLGKTGENLIEMENRLFETDHTIICYLIAKMWELPTPVRNAIYCHSETDLGYYKTQSDRDLSIILRAAEALLYDINKNASSNIFISDGYSIEQIEELLKEMFNIEPDYFEELYQLLETELSQN